MSVTYKYVVVFKPKAGWVDNIYLGNTGASAGNNTAATWDSNFVGVWHLKNSTTLDTNDSTSNGNTGNIDTVPGEALNLNAIGAIGSSATTERCTTI